MIRYTIKHLRSLVIASFISQFNILSLHGQEPHTCVGELSDRWFRKQRFNFLNSLQSHYLQRRIIINTTTLAWWRHQMETFSALLALCAGNPPVTGEFPSQRPVTQSFDVFFDLRLNKRLSKQSWGWWFETPLRSLWRHCNGVIYKIGYIKIRVF